MKATQKQLDYINYLMNQLGYSEDDLDKPLDLLTVREASRLIDDLRDELYGEV